MPSPHEPAKPTADGPAPKTEAEPHFAAIDQHFNPAERAVIEAVVRHRRSHGQTPAYVRCSSAIWNAVRWHWFRGRGFQPVWCLSLDRADDPQPVGRIVTVAGQ